MKRIKNAIILSQMVLSFAAYSQGYNLEKLTTKDGKIYQEVQIINSDKEGLLFRHKDGIIKESFAFLTPDIREMFAPIAQVPHAIEVDLSESMAIQDHEETPPKVQLPEIVFTFVIRRPVCTSAPHFCRMHRSPKNWPTQWHRFNDAHLLTDPVFRASVTRNFLLATQLLPEPCGAILHPSSRPHPIRR